MPSAFTLRAMTPDDSAALATLTEQSPDGGAVAFRPRFHLPAYQVYGLRHGDVVGVVAEANGAAGLVGAAHVSFGECQFEGRPRRYALLSALMVHPDYRRRGIAAALAQWRIERAMERSGADTILLADIQAGNVGSIANAKKWATQIAGKVVTSPVPMRTKPPRAEDGITVREAKPEELETIAENLNSFYRDYNFYQPTTAEQLQAWLQETPFATPIHHYLVAVDRAGRLLAGMSIQEEGRLMSLYIEKVPPLISLLNTFMHVIPADHEMRNLHVEQLWFAAGQLEAARQLWQTVRWEWRDRGSSVFCHYDPRSPIPQVLQAPAWMPATSTSIALRSDTPMSAARLIYPLV